jgi:hypothetical protein
MFVQVREPACSDMQLDRHHQSGHGRFLGGQSRADMPSPAASAARAAELRQHRSSGPGDEGGPPATHAALDAHAQDATGVIDIANAYECDVDSSTAWEEVAMSEMGASPERDSMSGQDVATAPQQSHDPVALNHEGGATHAAQCFDSCTHKHPSDADLLDKESSVDDIAEQPEGHVAVSGVRNGAEDQSMNSSSGRLPSNPSPRLLALWTEPTESRGARQEEISELRTDRASHGARGDVPQNVCSQELQEVVAILQALAELKNPQELEKALSALAVVEQIMANALRDPQNLKFRKVRRANKVFSSRVVPCPQVELLMQLGGFVLEGTTWTLEHTSNAAMLQLVHTKLRQWTPLPVDSTQSG